MIWFKKIPLLALLLLALMPGRGFSELYLKPGDSGVFDFTVINATDSVNPLAAPEVTYLDKPAWFNMGGVAVLPYDSLKQGTSAQVSLDFYIAEDAPSGTADLTLKVSFPVANVYPPVWYPGAKHKLVVDTTPPLISVSQPEWRNYLATTTVFSTDGGIAVVRGSQVNFTAKDGESGIADFQIINSSGQNLSAEYFTKSFNAVSDAASLSEDCDGRVRWPGESGPIFRLT